MCHLRWQNYGRESCLPKQFYGEFMMVKGEIFKLNY
jgi:hypothetical protein